MSKRMTILIAVTHLLGVGHFARMRLLARGLAEAGHAVTLISGGRPQPHLECSGFTLVQLPPVHCVGTDFSTLFENDGVVLTEQTRAARQALLVETCEAVKPDIVITETFPFGRRALKSEFIALCESAAQQRPRPAIVASIRDILNPPSSPAKANEAEDLIGQFYDAILVHGDAAWVSPDIGWPFGRNGRRALRMTGFIDDMAPTDAAVSQHGRIVVSGGGSSASLPLYRAAIAAAILLPEQKWHLLIGHGVAQADFDALVETAPPTMMIERARKDFRALLRGASVSVSQAGYNTIVDLFDAGPRMVLVPFAAGQEREQTLRAEALAARNLARIVTEEELNGATLARAIADVLTLPAPQRDAIARDGIRGSMNALSAVHTQRKAIETAWHALKSELSAIKNAHEKIDIWWRDDDAVSATPALTRLLELSAKVHAPVALAVIPGQLQADLSAALAKANCDILLHGIAHQNHAPHDQKKQELGYQSLPALTSGLRDGVQLLQARFPRQALRVLVPPWNRIDPELVPLLPEIGITGLSTFKWRPNPLAANGLLQVNTHCDPIAWRDGGGLRPEAELVLECVRLLQEARREPRAAREPLGLLTHHLVHDAAIWAFLERLFHVLATSGAVNFVSARTIFDVHQMVPSRAVLE